MDEYTVDILPGEVLDWVREDAEKKTPHLLVRASKEYSVETDFDREDAGIGDEDDVALVTERDVLTVTPQRGRRGWVLRLDARDSIGLKLSEEEGIYENEDDLPVEAFVTRFLAPEKGGIEVTVRADDAESWQRFQGWLARRRARQAAS